MTMTRDDFEKWVATLSAEQQEGAKGFFTVIRQQGAQLAMVPYNQEYRADLEKCAALLREAAALTDNASLQRFLTSRADAFLSNDYYESDMAWMDLDAPLDITIGPYETYNDQLFGYKAGFEGYINLRDEKETARSIEEQVLEQSRQDFEELQDEAHKLVEEHGELRADLAGFEERQRSERATEARLRMQLAEIARRVAGHLERPELRRHRLPEHLGRDASPGWDHRHPRRLHGRQHRRQLRQRHADGHL